jgi:hypothetical protein
MRRENNANWAFPRFGSGYAFTANPRVGDWFWNLNDTPPTVHIFDGYSWRLTNIQIT